MKHTLKHVSANAKLNPEHEIFKGHYPGQPVLPGACMLQIIKDVLETVLQAKLIMTKSSQLKFLAMVDPRQNTELSMDLIYNLIDDEIQVKASLIAGDVVKFKLSGSFKCL